MAPLGRAALLVALGLLAYALVAGAYAALRRRRRLADSARNALLASFGASAVAAGVLVVAPLEAPVPPDRLPRGSDVFGPLPRVLAAVASSVGALVVLGGAALSAWRLARTRRRDEPSDARPSAPRRLVAANLLIAGGTLVLGAGGLFNSVLDEMEAFAVTLVLGIALIFGGFLVATAPGGPRPATGARPDSEPARSAGRRSRAKFDRSPSPSS